MFHVCVKLFLQSSLETTTCYSHPPCDDLTYAYNNVCIDLSMARTSNYIPHIPWDVITPTLPWHLLLTYTSSYIVIFIDCLIVLRYLFHSFLNTYRLCMFKLFIIQLYSTSIIHLFETVWCREGLNKYQIYVHNCNLTHWPLEVFHYNLATIFKLTGDWWLEYFVKLPSDEFQMTTGHKSTSWCQEATSHYWVNTDPDLCRHMTSQSHNGLKEWFTF